MEQASSSADKSNQPNPNRSGQQRQQKAGQKSRRNRPKRANKRPQQQALRGRRKPADTGPLADVRKSFFACARCSFFYSSIRADLGVATLGEKAAKLRQGSLVLDWSETLRETLERHYGCHIHADTEFFVSTCSDCGRRFTVGKRDDETGPFTEVTIEATRYAGQLR